MDRYYKVLKLEPGASIEAVKRAYRRQVKFWHPDRLPSESPRLQKKAHEMLKEINEAYKKIVTFHKLRGNPTKSATDCQPSTSKTHGEKASAPPPSPKASTPPKKTNPPVKTDPPPPSKMDGMYILPNGDRYIGDIKNGLLHGQGAYIYSRGDKYVGEFKEGRPHGRGTFDYSNGDRYVGEFRDEEMNGQGTYFHKNGDQYCGEFRNGEPHGKGTYRRANGKEFHGYWENGALM